MPTTIQQTAKRFKLLMLLGVVAILLGLAAFLITPWSYFAAALLVLGLISYASGKVGAWWHHA